MSLSRTHHSTLMYVLSVVTALSTGIGAYFSFEAGSILGGCMTAVAVLVPALLLSFAAVRIEVTSDGVVARSGVFGFRLVGARADEITDVTQEDVNAAQWGGWGLRLTSRGTALILRSGTAAVIERRDKRNLLIAVDGAEDIAESLHQALGSRLR